MAPWVPSIKQAIETGAVYSDAFPLSDPKLVNSVGQLYHGPVVLITDAFCYSACDMFAAGFQDHEIGKIIGVDPNTGAGGANVFRHSDLRRLWPDGPLRRLPAGAQMRVSLRRMRRVGKRAGRPVEDLGVEPDIEYEMSRDDLLHSNRDLLGAAGAILADRETRTLEPRVVEGEGPDVHLVVETQNIRSIDVYVDDRPQTRVKTTDGETNVTVQVPAGESVVRLEGFARRKLVAGRLLRFNR
ncbi:MAG: hypothetical protein GY778_18550 [bacterium]|nr:hypothetical protein [bacterium]